MNRKGPPVPPIDLLGGRVYRCTCGRRIENPGVCGTCADDMLREEVQEASWFKVRERIPACYRWAKLSIRIRRNGHAIQESAQQEAREWDSTRFLLLRGETHCFKSTLAAAVLRSAIEGGIDGYFVPACNLSPEAPEDIRAQSAHAVRNMTALVVIDDLAAVFGGAPVKGALAAQRKGALEYWIRQRWERGANTVFTTALRDEGDSREAGILDAFGEDIFARLRGDESTTIEMVRT